MHLQAISRDVVEITARRGCGRRLRQSALQTWGLVLPPVGKLTRSGTLTALGIGPDTWSIMAVAAEPDALFNTLHVALHQTAAVVETGHGLVAMTLSGVRARHVLAKGCRLDLHPQVFQTGDVARTIVAQIPVLLWQIDNEPRFGLAAPLTLAHSFVHFVLAASAEVGCTILPISKE